MEAGFRRLEQVSDFQVTKTGANQWTINSRASTSAPVNGAIGPTAFQFAGPGTATTSGTSNTGSVFWCFHAANGTIHVKHNTSTSIAATGGIVVDTGQTSCGADLTLWITTMTSNVPDAITESMDFRSFVSFKPSPTAGAFIAITQGAQDTIALDYYENNDPGRDAVDGDSGAGRVRITAGLRVRKRRVNESGHRFDDGDLGRDGDGRRIEPRPRLLRRDELDGGGEMKLLAICLLPALPLFGSACGSGSNTITGAQVPPGGVTYRQAVIVFNVSHANNATVQIFSDSGCTKLIDDTNVALFNGASAANRVE